MSKMMCYAYQDTASNLKETKFGDHFVSDNSIDAIKDTLNYIKTQFPRRVTHFNSGAVLTQVWDVSDYAKASGKFYKRSHMDDVIRKDIGYKGTQGQEYHNMNIGDLSIKVNQILAQQGQKLITAKLSTMQSIVTEESLNRFKQGDKRLLLALCARFGKTICSGAIAVEEGVRLVVVAAYVKTVFASFAKDLAKFSQFSNMVHIDCMDSQYQTQIDKAIKNGQSVIAYLSLCPGTKRKQRINYLSNISTNRMWIVDEADFGAHTEKQVTALKEGVKDDDYLILMTGTNAERAVGSWKIDHVISVTYAELVIQKELSKGRTRSPSNTLQHFKIDIKRDILVPGLACYRADVKPIIDAVIDTLPESEFKLLPSWSKFAAHPIKGKAFFVRTLDAIYKGVGGHDHLNMDLQFMDSSLKVDMMFMSGGIRNDNLITVGDIARQTLPNTEVIVVCGGKQNQVYTQKIKNATAEAIVTEEVEKAQAAGRNVLIISAGMAVRSFSIPELTNIYLAYDEGDLGATIQKMSRALTSHKIDKVGRVVDLSFDPNRSDKFDQMIIETAVNFKKRHSSKSLAEAQSTVLTTLDVFDCTNSGPLPINKDEFLKGAMARKSVSRVIGNMINMSGMPDGMIEALASGNTSYASIAKTEKATKGTTRDVQSNGTKNKKKTSVTDLKKAREALVVIYENLDIIIAGTNNTTLGGAMKTIASNVDFKHAVEEQFEIEFKLLELLFEDGYLNEDFAQLMFDA